MALPSSPPISLNDIKTEFGATGTRSLTEFYRGGAFVPNTSANSGVPTSGAISLLDFLGASASPVIQLSNGSASGATSNISGSAWANVRLLNTGVCQLEWGSSSITGVIINRPTEWGPGVTASEYECYAGLVSGDTPTGNLGSWLNLGTSRDWGIQRNTVGNSLCVIQLSIRKVGTTTILAAAQFTLQANVGQL